MTGSPLSLDSLSSPSPSPSPPPTGKNQLHPPSKPRDATGPALDSGSELSELTDDDQDGVVSADKRERPPISSALPTIPSSKPVLPTPSATPGAVPSSLDPDATNRPSTSRRGAIHNRTTSTSRRGGGPRKKRSSLVPAPMWGWAETKAPTSSAPVEEEEEEMAGPPRAMEEEEEGPDDHEEEEEDEFDSEHSAVVDEPEEEDAGFVSQRRLGPYVTQRLPGIRSIYSSNARGRHPRRQITTSSRKYDSDDPQPHINGDDHKNGSASGSEYNSQKKKKSTKSRPPPSAGSRRRKGSPTRESSGSDHPPAAGKHRKTQHQAGDVESAASDVSTQSRDEDEQNPISPSPSKFLPGSKPLSAIATSSINPAAAALAALAVIADSVEINTASPLESKHSSSPKSPNHDLSLTTNSTTSVVEATSVPSRSRTASPDNQAISRKRPTRRAPPRSKKPSDDWRRLTKPPGRPPNAKKRSIDLKIDIPLEPAPDDPVVEAGNEEDTEMEVDRDADETNDLDKNADEEIEDEDAEEEVSQHDDDETATVEDAVEGDEEAGDPEGEGDEDQEVEANELENEQENDNENENENENEEEENEEEPSPEADLEDQEIELQPAHRAEALDVLASIELKFAMLRERVYMEKMEILAWEEGMIQGSVHPEMQYLQKEMTKRRDKRLELASRKRSYEISNATKRRKADEGGVWSWWKLTVDELQTDMIAETNRKRRRLERERRALERPQPIRRIPLPPTDIPLLPQPSLRKLLKSYPFVHKPIRRRRHRHARNHQPKNLVYPEISTLSVLDINHDLEFLYQNRRLPSSSSYDTLGFGEPPSMIWGQGSSFPHRTATAVGGGLPGLARVVGLGLGHGHGNNNGASLPPNQPMIPQPMMHHHHHHHSLLGYEQQPQQQYPDASSSFGGSRLRDVYTHGPPPPPPPPTLVGSREAFGYSTHPLRNQPSPLLGGPANNNHMVGYAAAEHEMASGGHQLMPNHPHFGQGGSGGPNAFRPSSSHENGLKGVVVGNGNGRRSPLSPHLSNGMTNSKSNGGWMGMGAFQVGKGGIEREGRMPHGEDERDGGGRRDRKRLEREKELERQSDYWEKEYLEYERSRDLGYVHPPPSSHQYGHGSGAPTPGPPGVEGHHHHRQPHHHHVLHHHGPPLPPPSPVHPGSGGPPPIVHSPRSTRDYDMPMPGSSVNHLNNEGMVLPSSVNNKPPTTREKERELHWSQQRNVDAPVHHSPSMHDYRDRDKELRKVYSHRPLEERPPSSSSPFIMAPGSAAPPVPPPSSHMNGSGINTSSTSSPKGQQTIWADDASSYRIPSGGYMPHETHRSPVQAQRYTPGTPSGRNSLPSAGSIHRIVSPAPLPVVNRSRPPPPPSPFLNSASLHRSPPTSPRLAPSRSPTLVKPLLSSGRGTPTGQRTTSTSTSHTPLGHHGPSDPHLKNGTSFGGGGRTESPRMSSALRQGLNGNNGGGGGGVEERHAMSVLSPRLAPPGLHPSKLSATPVSDRR